MRIDELLNLSDEDASLKLKKWNLKPETVLTEDEQWELYNKIFSTQFLVKGIHLPTAFLRSKALHSSILNEILTDLETRLRKDYEGHLSIVSREDFTLKQQQKVFQTCVKLNDNFLYNLFESNLSLHPSIVSALCDNASKQSRISISLAYRDDLTLNNVKALLSVPFCLEAYAKKLRVSGEFCASKDLPFRFLMRNNPSFVIKEVKANLVDVETFKVLSESSDLTFEELIFLTKELGKEKLLSKKDKL